VGGGLRDTLAGVVATDWDLATAAHPEQVLKLFPSARWENRFGTVSVPVSSHVVQVTSYRTEAAYADRRRPSEVRFGGTLREDLARRDFTINALAWLPARHGPGDGGDGARDGWLLDPHDGRGDLERRMLRAVGDPDQRFAEDALRLLRAVRFATGLRLELEAATRAAIVRHAGAVRHLSAERVRDELMRILADERAPPSTAFGLMEELGLLGPLLPELARLRGVPQAKPVPGDVLDHSLRTLDALPAADPLLRLAGLLHDVGKPATQAGGHFYDHERVGAEIADRLLERLRLPRPERARIVALVRHHMFAYTPTWTDAAVRRLIQRVGADRLADLFVLRRADNAASGVEEPAAGSLAALERRVREQLDAERPLAIRQLAIDGHDLMRELQLAPGPRIGEILDDLLAAVVDEPELNEHDRLLERARRALESDSNSHRARPG
jgi:tRNA nucleotidyltransferase (CCA-adding enzyme)